MEENQNQDAMQSGATEAPATGNVTVYSTPTCHFCHAAKDFFKEHEVAFTDIDVAADAEKRQEMVEMTGQMGVPVIKIGDEVMVGFDEAKVKAALGM
ncbi:MAG: glutaredoxin family protein [Candidatus Pacebacteria bacterium]|nr:glutaredoxin family protein [Candidatus Paceibacterota bacterium]